MELELERRETSGEKSDEALVEAAKLFVVSYAQATLEWVATPSRSSLAFALHPVAPALELEVSGPRVVLQGDTLALGPGYDGYVRRLADALGRELGLGSVVERGPGGSAEERALAYLGRAAAMARPETGPHRIGDFGHHRYPEVALATLLGPRVEAWRLRVAANPSEGLDAFPWPRDGAEHLRGRALALLWHEVRYRPLLSEAEEEVCESALEDLRAAHREAPALHYPIEAWAEVSALLGGRLPPPRSARAQSAADSPPGVRGPIGYRRLTVERDVGAGFSIRFPGELAEEEREDGIWAGDLARSIHVAGILAEPGVPALLLLDEAEAPEGTPIAIALPGLETRAAVREVGDETVLTAVAASDGALCLLTAVERGGGSSFVRAVAASLARTS